MMKIVEIHACLKHSRFQRETGAWKQVTPPTNSMTDFTHLFNHNTGINFSFTQKPCDLCGVAK